MNRRLCVDLLRQVRIGGCDEGCLSCSPDTAIYSDICDLQFNSRKERYKDGFAVPKCLYGKGMEMTPSISPSNTKKRISKEKEDGSTYGSTRPVLPYTILYLCTLSIYLSISVFGGNTCGITGTTWGLV